METSLLRIISRLTCTPEHYQLIQKECERISNWDLILSEAEFQGVAPLLRRHVVLGNAQIPESIKRKLHLLHIRHTQTNLILARWLRIISTAFSSAHIQTIVLKGAALVHTLYEELGLRPMRDLDILIAKNDIRQCLDILLDFGFQPSGKPIPENHFHIQPLYLKSGGVKICVELHHDLYPTCPPFCENPPFEDLLKRSIGFKAEGDEIRTLGYEDMLTHLYQHGLKTPLTYEPFKLIHVADIVSYVEKYSQSIDWTYLQRISPRIVNGLAYLGEITPWQKHVAPLFQKKLRIDSASYLPFTWWPHNRLAQLRGTSFKNIFLKSLWPPKWWFLTFYGSISKLDYYLHRFIHHPVHILWWIRIYWDLFIKEKTNPVPDTYSFPQKLFAKLKNLQIIQQELLKKIRSRSA